MDRIVAITGMAMALILVLSNGRIRALKVREAALLAAVWVAIIALAAFAFRAFRT